MYAHRPYLNKNPNCNKDIGEKYIVENVKEVCDLTDSEKRVGQCFKHSLIREPNVGM